MSDISSGPDGLVDSAKCDCCGLIEECTPSYIQAIQERYGGKWICGLCAEAVKDETIRCEKMLISPDEALARHLSFCNEVRASGRPPTDPTVRLIRALRSVLRRSLDGLRSVPASPRDAMEDVRRPESCITKLPLVETAVYVEYE